MVRTPPVADSEAWGTVFASPRSAAAASAARTSGIAPRKSRAKSAADW